MKKVIILCIFEIIVIGILCALLVTGKGERNILNPDISNWESRYVNFDGMKWACDESVVQEDMEDGGEIDMIYGPFFSLPKGNYSISIDYKCDSSQTFAVYSFLDPDAIMIHEEEQLLNEKESQTFHFTLLRPVDDLEVRFHYNGNGALEVYNINIVQSSFLLREIILVLFLLFVFADICILLYMKRNTGDDRELWIDVCRGIGIILVLLGHSTPPFRWLIFGFHMPLFFILSGYLFKEGGKASVYISRLFRRYIVPYFAFAGINLIVKLIEMFVDDTLTWEWVFRFLFQGIADSGEWLPGCTPLWFLPALFMTMTGMYFIHNRLPDLPQRMIAVILCLTASSLMGYFNGPNVPWNIGQAMMGIVFAETGFLIKKYGIIEKIAALKMYNKIGLGLISLTCGINAVWYNYSYKGYITSMRSMRYGFIPLWLMGAILLSVFLMSLCNNVCRLKIHGLTVPLAMLGRNTMIFFAFDFCMGAYSSRILEAYIGYSPWYFDMPVKFLLLTGLFYIGRLVKLDRISGKNI